MVYRSCNQLRHVGSPTRGLIGAPPTDIEMCVISRHGSSGMRSRWHSRVQAGRASDENYHAVTLDMARPEDQAWLLVEIAKSPNDDLALRGARRIEDPNQGYRASGVATTRLDHPQHR